MYNVDKERVVWRRVDDEETVVLDTKTGYYYVLNGVAGIILDLLAEGSAVNEISEHIVQKYDVQKDVVVRDIAELLESMKVEGLIQNEKRE